MAGISAKDVKALRDQTDAGMMDCKKALVDADGDTEKAIDLLRERGLSKAGKRAGRETSEGAIGVSLQGGLAVMAELGCETDFVAKNEQFQSLVQRLVDAIAQAGGVDGVDAALAVALGDGSIDDEIKSAVGVVGENIQLKRVASIEAGGAVSGYVHGGGSLGVIVGFEDTTADALGETGKDIAMHVAAADPTPLAVDRDGLDAELVEKEKTILRSQALQSGKPEKIVENIVNGRIGKFFSEHCLMEQAFVKDTDKSVADVLNDAGGARVSRFIRFKLGEAAGQ